MIIHDNSIKKIVEHRKNELSENIDTYVLKLYPNIGTYTIFEFHYVHTDNISVYTYIYIYLYHRYIRSEIQKWCTCDIWVQFQYVPIDIFT